LIAGGDVVCFHLQPRAAVRNFESGRSTIELSRRLPWSVARGGFYKPCLCIMPSQRKKPTGCPVSLSIFGTPERIRTSDLRNRNPEFDEDGSLLYVFDNSGRRRKVFY
jgi:hypothetical protein